MIEARLEIDGKEIATDTDIPISINFVLADVREPDKRNASFSKTIKIPSTNEINKIFENIFEVNIATQYFNKNLKTPVKYFVNNELNFEGDLQLMKINIEPTNKISFDCSIIGQGGSLFVDIGDKYITGNADSGDDLDFSDYDHTLTRTDIIASYANAGTGLSYVYPFIHYGTNNGTDTLFNCKDFVPCFHAHEYVKKIIEKTGRTYTSTFLNSSFFKKLIIPPNINRIPLSQSQLDERQFYAGITTDTTLAIGSGTLSGTEFRWGGLSYTINHNRETSPYFDPNGINNGTSATINNNGTYNIAATERYKIYFTHSDGSVVKMKFQAIFNSNVERSTNGGSTYLNFGVGGQAYNSGTGFIDIGSANAIFINAGVASVNTYLLDGDFIRHTILLSNIRATFYDNADVIVTTGTPTLTIELLSGDTNATSFYALASGKEVADGNDVFANQALPQKIKQKDLLKWIVQMFNLYIDIDKNDPNNLIIEDYNEFYNGDIVDYENRTDLLKEQTINPNLLEGKRYIYKYKGDKDYYNTKYEDTYNEPFGTETIITENDFKNQDKVNEVGFSPTPNVANYDLGIIHPKIYQSEQTLIKPIAPNIRILICGGVKQTQAPWTFGQVGLSDIQTNDYLYAGHVDDPLSPTIDINFGVPREVYYNYINAYFTDNNLFNLYHKNGLDNVTHRDSKFVTKFLWLTSRDIKQFNFRNRFFIDGAYYIFNKISDYDPSKQQSVKCELIKLLTTETHQPTSTLISDQPALVNGAELLRPKDNTSLSIGDNVQNRGVNSVAIGNNIIIPASASNITVVGNNVRVAEGISNVSVINTNDIEVTQSGVNIVNSINQLDYFLDGYFTTTDATPSEITFNTDNGLFDMTGVDVVIRAELRLLAVDVATGDCKEWRSAKVFKNISSITSTQNIESMTTVVEDASMTTATATFGDDATPPSIEVSITGIAATTIEWKCYVNFIRIEI